MVRTPVAHGRSWQAVAQSISFRVSNMANLNGKVAQVGPILPRVVPLLSDLAIQLSALLPAYQSPFAPPAYISTKRPFPDIRRSASRGGPVVACSGGEVRKRNFGV